MTLDLLSRPYWSLDDKTIADAEGWLLSERSDGYYEIQRDDDTKIDEWCDYDAYRFVRNLAEQGSPVHQKAIVLHGTRTRH